MYVHGLLKIITLIRNNRKQGEYQSRREELNTSWHVSKIGYDGVFRVSGSWAWLLMTPISTLGRVGRKIIMNSMLGRATESTNQLTSEINQPAIQSTKQLTNQLTNQPNKQVTYSPTSKPTNQLTKTRNNQMKQIKRK